MRTTDDPLRALNALRREIQVVDPQVALANPITLERAIQMNFYLRASFSLLVLGMFAATGACPRRARRLWCARVHRLPADARDRNPDGARRRTPGTSFA